MDQDSVDAAISTVGHKATYVGAGTGFLGWLASADIVSLLGLGVAMVGFGVNVFFKVRDDRRKQRLFDAQMKQIDHGVEPLPSDE